MTTILILLVGVSIVVGGILLLRLHAFLALILAALVVSALTPSLVIERNAVEQNSITLVKRDDQSGEFRLQTKKKGLRVGMQLVVLRYAANAEAQEVGQLKIVRIEAEVRKDGGKSGKLNVYAVAEQSAEWTWQANDLVVHPTDLAAAKSMAKQTVGERVGEAFGSTCVKIGILIAMAAIIGKCLLDSGAADRIVRSALKLFGERSAPAAFVGSGFLLGIPVFFDTVFYLMIPLGKALRIRTGRNYLLYVLTIVAGATMAHSLVPPTPGPLFVAEELGVDLGLMIIAGGIVGLFSAAAGYLWAQFVNRRCDLPLRESPDFTLKDIDELIERDERHLPPLWLSLIPILLPVILIAGYTVLENFDDHFTDEFMSIAESLGNKNLALALSAGIALLMLVRQTRISRLKLAESVQSALSSGGVIILITAGGGAFGQAMQQTGVSSMIQSLPQGSVLVTLPLAFLVTTAIRTAQGSATVAMITAVGILSGIAASGDLGFHPVYLALAIGCGSKPVAWMNDSGFWVICKMSGMTEGEGLRFISPMSGLMGLVGLVVTVIAALVVPMAG